MKQGAHDGAPGARRSPFERPPREAGVRWTVSRGASATVVFFDLDDTLFDHTFSASAGLGAVADAYPVFARRPIEDLVARHARHVEALHRRVLAGELSIEAARVARFEALCRECGARDLAGEQVAETYRGAYARSRRVVPGTVALLATLRARVRVGIVTNNLVGEQLEKLRVLELGALVDVLVISEEAGVAKPDPEIFQIALARANCAAREAVMVGDSWATDVLGARAAGVRPVWFNRTARPCPEPGWCAELQSFLPAEAACRLIVGPPGSAVRQ